MHHFIQKYEISNIEVEKKDNILNIFDIIFQPHRLVEVVFELMQLTHKTVAWNKMKSNYIEVFSFYLIIVTFVKINHSVKFKLFC